MKIIAATVHVIHGYVYRVHLDESKVVASPDDPNVMIPDPQYVITQTYDYAVPDGASLAEYRADQMENLFKVCEGEALARGIATEAVPEPVKTLDLEGLTLAAAVKKTAKRAEPDRQKRIDDRAAAKAREQKA